MKKPTERVSPPSLPKSRGLSIPPSLFLSLSLARPCYPSQRRTDLLALYALLLTIDPPRVVVVLVNLLSVLL